MGKLKNYSVTLPIAGHIVVSVEAENEDDAIEKAFESDYSLKDIEDWEPVEAFHKGNVCYCPHPWEAEAECEDGDDDGDAE